MRIVINSRAYLVQEGKLTLLDMNELTPAPEQELSSRMATIRGGAAEIPLSVAGTFLVMLSDCQVVRRSDHMQFRVSKLGILPINISPEDIRSGSARLNIDLFEPLLISISDQHGQRLKKTRVLLVNTEQCQQFTTDEYGEVIVFEQQPAYRIVVPDHPEAKVTVKRLL